MLPRDYHEGDAEGVKLDTLVDGRIGFENAEHQLNDIDVMLDSLADDAHLWTDGERAELRSIQRAVRTLAKAKRADENDTAERLAELRGD